MVSNILPSLLVLLRPDVPWGHWNAYCLIGVAKIWICCSPIYNLENVPGILYEMVYLSVLYISYGSQGILNDIRRIFQIFCDCGYFVWIVVLL